MFHALSAILCDSLIQNVNYLRGFQYAVAASIYFVPVSVLGGFLFTVLYFFVFM